METLSAFDSENKPDYGILHYADIECMRALFIFILMVNSKLGWSYTANYVHFEFLDNGRYRVKIFYTVPELKEFSESYVDFTKKKAAEKFYFDLLKGGDFYHPHPEGLEFKNGGIEPEPW